MLRHRRQHFDIFLLRATGERAGGVYVPLLYASAWRLNRTYDAPLCSHTCRIGGDSSARHFAGRCSRMRHRCYNIPLPFGGER